MCQQGSNLLISYDVHIHCNKISGSESGSKRASNKISGSESGSKRKDRYKEVRYLDSLMG